MLESLQKLRLLLGVVLELLDRLKSLHQKLISADVGLRGRYVIAETVKGELRKPISYATRHFGSLASRP